MAPKLHKSFMEHGCLAWYLYHTYVFSKAMPDFSMLTAATQIAGLNQSFGDLFPAGQ